MNARFLLGLWLAAVVPPAGAENPDAGPANMVCVSSVAVSRKPPLFELADPGTERVVDYEKYGVFENPGTFEFRYVIRDRAGLARASGAGIEPNLGAARDPAYRAVRDRKGFRKNIWEHQPHLSNDPEADFFAWATSGESPAVKLLNAGIALEEAGQFEHALKAYRAAMILHPTGFGWSAKMRWTWLVAPQAWGRIVSLTRAHPELNLKLDGANVIAQVKVGNDWTRNRVLVEPGRFVKWSGEDRAARRRDPARMKVVEKRGGTVAAVKYENGDWGFQVEGRPFTVKGVTYTPTRVGKHLNEWNWMLSDENDNGVNDVAFESWVDANRNGQRDAGEPVAGDFKLLQEMGCNTIRWINELPLNLELLRRMHREYGIRAAICEPLGAYVIHSGATWEEGTDYTNPVHRKNMLEAVRRLAEKVKDEPWLLCYILGNENNMPTDSSSMVNASRTNAFDHPEAYAQFLNEAARLIHQIDPNHPVGVGNQGWGMIDVYARHAPELDFVGVNEYIGWKGFGALFEHVRRTFDRPVMVTEYGCDAYWTGRGPDEEWQERYHRGCWEDIEANAAGGEGAGNCAGGIVFEFLDEWWKDNSRARLVDGVLVDPGKTTQSCEPTIEMAFPDGWSQEEWFGIVGQGDGKSSPFLRQPRKTYYLYQGLWNRS